MKPNEIHSEEREKEVQELCSKVINCSANNYYNSHGADEVTCPFCFAVDYSNGCTANMEDLKHLPDCAYNIAKGLSANILTNNSN